MRKRIKAPDYFLENLNKIQEIGEAISRLIGVGEAWLNIREGSWIPKEMVKDLNREERVRLERLMNIRKAYIQYGWARFKHLNLDNPFGQAERLEFDKDKKQIIIHKGLMSYIRKFTGEMKEKFPDLVMGK